MPSASFAQWCLALLYHHLQLCSWPGCSFSSKLLQKLLSEALCKGLWRRSANVTLSSIHHLRAEPQADATGRRHAATKELNRLGCCAQANGSCTHRQRSESRSHSEIRRVAQGFIGALAVNVPTQFHLKIFPGSATQCSLFMLEDVAARSLPYTLALRELGEGCIPIFAKVCHLWGQPPFRLRGRGSQGGLSSCVTKALDDMVTNRCQAAQPLWWLFHLKAAGQLH